MGGRGEINVFPISASAFGLRTDWFETFSPRLIDPAYLLMVLFLVLSVGIMVLRQFEHARLERKLWNLPIIILTVAFWPFLVLGLKDLVDTFNTFLVREIFRMPWDGFGFPEMGSVTNIFGWSAEALARLLPNLAYWIIYGFYMIFFFFFAILGPLILAKGILFDEIEAFLELIKELAVLFLWQTTLVILVAFIMPDIVSGEQFPATPEANFYFLSVILGIMIFFVPTITRKFGNHLGSALFPPGATWLGLMAGYKAFGAVASVARGSTGFGGGYYALWGHRILKGEEFWTRYHFRRENENKMEEIRELEHELRECEEEDLTERFDTSHRTRGPHHRSTAAVRQAGVEHKEARKRSLLDNSRRARIELETRI